MNSSRRTTTSKVARVFWAVSYLFLFLAGCVAFFTPLQTVEGALVKALVYAWALFLTFGGLVSFIGKLRNSWVGEMIGLPALSAANYVLGLLLLGRGSSNVAVIIFGGIFLGMGTAFIGRWVELYNLSKVSKPIQGSDQ